MRRRVAVLLLSVAAVACGGTGGRDAAPDTTAVATTDVTTAGSSVPSTSAAPPFTAGPSTISPPDTTDGKTDPTEPVAVDAVALGPPDPALVPSALPPTDIDWSAVGPNWLLIDHGPTFDEPVTLDRRGFYLVSPDDVVYAVSALPTDGSRLSSVSADGRQALLQLVDPVCADGCTCPGDATDTSVTDAADDSGVLQEVFGYALLDLRTTTLRPVIDPVTASVCDTGGFLRDVEFSLDGAGVWVSETWFTDDHRVARVRLGRVDIGTGTATTILDEPVAADDGAALGASGISVAELADDRIVVATLAGTWHREADGSPVVELDVPHPSCRLVRVWGDARVLARCPASTGDFPLPPDVPAEQCWASGLWTVAVDGSPAQLLAVPLDDEGRVSCWVGYADAHALGDELAVGVGGDGCSDDVVLIGSDGTVTRWLPDFADSCTESLLGVRNGVWLMWAGSETGAGGVFEVTSDRTTRLDPPPGSITVL